MKAHIAQSQQSNPASTAAVSRPSHQALPRPQDPARISSGVAAQPVAAATVVQQLPKSQPSEFANFADFDSVAFDSLPAGTLAVSFLFKGVKRNFPILSYARSSVSLTLGYL